VYASRKFSRDDWLSACHHPFQFDLTVWQKKKKKKKTLMEKRITPPEINCCYDANTAYLSLQRKAVVTTTPLRALATTFSWLSNSHWMQSVTLAPPPPQLTIYLRHVTVKYFSLTKQTSWRTKSAIIIVIIMLSAIDANERFLSRTVRGHLFRLLSPSKPGSPCLPQNNTHMPAGDPIGECLPSIVRSDGSTKAERAS
jgi:hypothetical protein